MITRLVVRIGIAALLDLGVLVTPMTPEAVAESGVYVDIRESDAPGAPVVERWKLYGASHALVIGIDNYTNGWPRLSNAIKDARLVAEEMKGRGFEVKLITDVNHEALRDELRRFFAIKGSDPEARLFVWFGGHGDTMYGEGYIVPADAPPPGNPDFLLTALHMGDIGTMVRQARAKHVFVVFDSCFAGTIFSTQRSRPPEAVTRAAVKPVRQFLTSGEADQKVSDDGTFRSLFLGSLRGEEPADLNRDGYVTGSELSLYLEDRMINLTRAAQTPRGGKLRDPRFDRGDFIFVLPGKAAGPVQAAKPEDTGPAPQATGPSEAALDLEFWNAVKNSSDPSDYRAYLETFPEGYFAPLARARLLDTKAGQSEEEPRAKVAVKPQPSLQVAALDQVLYAAESANVRALPTTRSDKLATVAAGSRLQVTGILADGKWYRVALTDGTAGFVWGPLLALIPPQAVPKTAAPQEPREPAPLPAKLAPPGSSPAASGADQTAALTQDRPASGSPAGTTSQAPLKPRDEVEAYLDRNSRKLKTKLGEYNEQHRVVKNMSSQNPSHGRIKRIHKMKLKNLAGDRVFLEISFTVGRYLRDQDHGTALFELMWKDDELEFVGHKKIAPTSSLGPDLRTAHRVV